MLDKLRRRMASDESGFTLVELLVVMLIIGLLAAIAIPSFFNQRDKAKDADAKESVRTAQTAVETYSTDNGGVYTGATAAGLKVIETTLNDTPGALTVTAGANNYTLGVASKTGTVFTIARAANGQVTYTCNKPNVGGCPSNSDWGG
jgi:type IV pilus assembly protein PilA